MISADAHLTIVVVPREKYRCAQAVLRSLLVTDAPPFRLVWVDDARAPRRLRRWVGRLAERAGITHLSLGHRAGVNECRTRGLELATTPFVLFLDNDTYLGPGAVARMLDCMRATNASFVAPIYLERDGTVHNAGGRTLIVDGPDGRCLLEEHRVGAHGTATRHDLVRMRTDALEMHAVLVRRSSLTAAGGLDAGLVSSMDCADLSLRLQDIDGCGWLEPTATVTYDSSMPRPSDLSTYLGRWCNASVDRDIARFASRWGLDPHGARLETHRQLLGDRKMRVSRFLRGAVRRTFGQRAASWLDGVLDPFFDRLSDARGAPST